MGVRVGVNGSCDFFGNQFGFCEDSPKYAIDATPLSNYHTKYYTMNPSAAAMPASVGLKDSSSSSCVNNDTSVEPGLDLIA